MPVHNLELTYKEYQSSGKSIAYTMIDKYFIYEKIGAGSFGSVYKGMNDENKKLIAVKVLDLVSIENEKSPKVKEIRQRLAKSQSELMMRCDSNNVMKCYDVYQNKCLKVMMIQYCNQGTLADLLAKKGRIPQKQSIDIIKQLLYGISQMHSKGIIHRDLKTQNIMFHNGILKIVDLGFSKAISRDPQAITPGTILGTIITMAPEVMKRKPYGLKADIWSIGIILYEIIYGRCPYQPLKAPEMYDQIMSTDIFPNGGKISGIRPSEQVLDLMKKILVIDQKQRLTWGELLHHPAFEEDEQLPETYRVTRKIGKISQEKPTVKDRTDQQYLEQLQFLPKEKGEEEKIPVKPISLKQSENKKKQVNHEDQMILKWARQNYHECLKTQLILKRIILPIEKHFLLDLEERSNVQLMYLLTSRCFLNMSFIKHELQKNDHDHVINLNEIVAKLYKEVRDKFYYYSQQLIKQEDKITEIISDRFSKIFHSSSMKKKDRFLGGIQNSDFEKQEQIQYTYSKYIAKIFPKIKDESVQVYLQNYKIINQIKIQQMKERTFNQFIIQIVKK